MSNASLSAPETSAPGTPRSRRLLFGLTLQALAGSRLAIIQGLVALIPVALALFRRVKMGAVEIDDFLVEILPNVVLGTFALSTLFSATSVFRDRIEDHTLGFLLVRPMSRVAIFQGQMLGLLGLLLPLAALSIVGAYWCAVTTPEAWFGTVEQRSLLWPILAVGCLAMVLYASLFAWLGIAFSRPAIAGIFYLGIFEFTLASVPGPARLLSPMSWLEVLLGDAFRTRNAELLGAATMEGTPDAGPESPLAALVVIGVLIVLTQVGIAVAAARRDLVPGPES